MDNKIIDNTTQQEQPKESKFKAQLVVIIIGALFLPMLFIAYSFYDQWANMGRTEGTGEIGRVAVKMGDNIDRELGNNVGVIRIYASMPNLDEKFGDLALPQYWDGIAIVANNKVTKTKGIIDYSLVKGLIASARDKKIINTTVIDKNGKKIVVFATPTGENTFFVSQIDFGKMMEEKVLAFQRKSKSYDVYVVGDKGEILYQINNTNPDPAKVKRASDIGNEETTRRITSMSSFGLKIIDNTGKPYVFGAYPSKVFGEFQGLPVNYVVKVPAEFVKEKSGGMSGILLMGIFSILLLLIYYSLNFKQSVSGKAPVTNKKWYE